MTDTERVAVSIGRHDDRKDRRRVHDAVDGEPACHAANQNDLEFEIVTRAEVAHLQDCRHCSGEAQTTGGQGSPLAAKLAAADPEEVSSR